MSVFSRSTAVLAVALLLLCPARPEDVLEKCVLKSDCQDDAAALQCFHAKLSSVCPKLATNEVSFCSSQQELMNQHCCRSTANSCPKISKLPEMIGPFRTSTGQSRPDIQPNLEQVYSSLKVFGSLKDSPELTESRLLAFFVKYCDIAADLVEDKSFDKVTNLLTTDSELTAEVGEIARAPEKIMSLTEGLAAVFVAQARGSQKNSDFTLEEVSRYLAVGAWRSTLHDNCADGSDADVTAAFFDTCEKVMAGLGCSPTRLFADLVRSCRASFWRKCSSSDAGLQKESLPLCKSAESTGEEVGTTSSSTIMTSSSTNSTAALTSTDSTTTSATQRSTEELDRSTTSAAVWPHASVAAVAIVGYFSWGVSS